MILMIDRLETLVLEAYGQLWPSGPQQAPGILCGPPGSPDVLRSFGSENFAGPWVGSDTSSGFAAKPREGPVEAAISGSGYPAEIYYPLLMPIPTTASANLGSE